MRILIVDDQEADRVLSAAQCKALGYTNLHFASTYQEALDQLANQKPDLLICDFQLDGSYTGTDVLRNGTFQASTGVIIVTNMFEESVYEELEAVRPVLFLAKGFSTLEFRQSLEYVRKGLAGEQSIVPKKTDLKEKISVKIGDKFKIITVQDIEYFEADGKYLNLYIGTLKYNIRMSMTRTLNVLPDNFMRVHGSYIVNLDRVLEIIPADQIIKLSEATIPYSRNYRRLLFERFSL